MLPHMAGHSFRAGDLCIHAPTISGTPTLTGSEGTCAGTGITFEAAWSISGSYGSNYSAEIWYKKWEDAASEPGSWTYDGSVGRITTSPQNVGNLANPLRGSDGPGTAVTMHAKVRIVIVHNSTTEGSDDEGCDFADSAQEDVATNECTI